MNAFKTIIKNECKNIKVLYVTDTPQKFSIFKYSIERITSSVLVFACYSSESAVKTFDKYDCIVANLNIHKMNGLELAKAIKKEKDFPIILYTDSRNGDIIKAVFESIVDDYILMEKDTEHFKLLINKITMCVERSRFKKSFEKCENELNWLIEHSLDSIAKIELEKGITRYNSVFQKLFGFSESEIKNMGIKMLELLHEDDRDKFMTELDRLYSHKIKQYVTLNRWYTKSGKIKWIQSHVYSIFENGDITGIYLIDRDISEYIKFYKNIQKKDSKFINLLDKNILYDNFQYSTNELSTRTPRFDATVRYIGASNIITLPIKIVRDLDIKIGDKISVKIQKKENDVS